MYGGVGGAASPSSSSPLLLFSVRTPLAPVALTMRCRQRPQRVHCLGDDGDALCLYPTVRPSVPPASAAIVSRSSVATAAARPSIISLSLSVSLLLPSPQWAQEAQLPSKNRNKQTPPPSSLS